MNAMDAQPLYDLAPVAWLLGDIWPRVRRRLPAAGLILAGNDPTGEMRALADPAAGVEARGFVEDVGATTREAAVCLAPLRFGGGIRLKVLEALANERPVVGTPSGLEGLALRAGECGRIEPSGHVGRVLSMADADHFP